MVWLVRTKNYLVDLNPHSLKAVKFPKKTYKGYNPNESYESNEVKQQLQQDAQLQAVYKQLVKNINEIGSNASCFRYWSTEPLTSLPPWWHWWWAMGNLTGPAVPKPFYVFQPLSKRYLALKSGAVTLVGSASDATVCILPDDWLAAVKASGYYNGSTAKAWRLYIKDYLPKNTLLMLDVSNGQVTGGSVTPTVLAHNFTYHVGLGLNTRKVTDVLKAIPVMGYGCGYAFRDGSGQIVLWTDNVEADCSCHGLYSSPSNHFGGAWNTACDGGVVHGWFNPPRCSEAAVKKGKCKPSQARKPSFPPVESIFYLDVVSNQNIQCVLPPLPAAPAATPSPLDQVEESYRTDRRLVLRVVVATGGALVLLVGLATWEWSRLHRRFEQLKRSRARGGRR